MSDELRNSRIRDGDESLEEKGTRNRASGAGDQISGRVRNALGALTGDDSQQLKGKAQELKGKAKSNLGKAQQDLDDAIDRDRPRSRDGF